MNNPQTDAEAGRIPQCVPRIGAAGVLGFNWCEGMRLALTGTPENHDGKGLSVSRGWLGDEEKPRFLGVTYKPRPRAQGLVLNHCPWCGQRITVAGG